MHKKIKVQLLVNEVAGNGNAIKADKELQDILKEMNILSDKKVIILEN